MPHSIPPFPLKISRRGEPEKNLGWGNQKTGEIFRRKGGSLLFKLNLCIEKDKNGNIESQSSMNFLEIFACISKHCCPLGQISYISFLNISKERLYRAIYTKVWSFLNFALKICSKIRSAKRGGKFQEKKREPEPCTLCCQRLRPYLFWMKFFWNWVLGYCS